MLRLPTAQSDILCFQLFHPFVEHFNGVNIHFQHKVYPAGLKSNLWNHKTDLLSNQPGGFG